MATHAVILFGVIVVCLVLAILALAHVLAAPLVPLLLFALIGATAAGALIKPA